MSNPGLFVVSVITTWADGALKVAVLRDGDTVSLPMAPITLEPSSSLGASHEASRAAVAQQNKRIHSEQLPAILETESGVTQLIIPFLALCPSDAIKAGVDLADLDSLEKKLSSSAQRAALVECKKRLTLLVGTSTACLHLLPSFFPNVDIRLIHNALLGGEVNRMTLRRRYELTGYVTPTGEKLAGKHGRQPQIMMPMIDELYVFGAMITTTDKDE